MPAFDVPGWPSFGWPGFGVGVDAAHGGHRVVVSSGAVQVETPPVEHLLFYVGIGALAAAEVVEWPVAVLLMVGHVLIDATRPGLHALGEAVEEAA